MVKVDNINSFISLNYVPFSKRQCVKRIFTIWCISVFPCVLGNIFSLILFLAGNIIITLFYLVLIIKYSKLKIARFLCDGITFLYTSLMINVLSYEFIVLQNGDNLGLFIFYIVTYFSSIGMYCLIACRNIKEGSYNDKKMKKGITVLPYFGGLCGITAAKFLLKESVNNIILFVSIVLLLSSLLLSAGSVNLLKAILLIKLDKNTEFSSFR